MGGHILPMDPVVMVLGAADHVKCAMNKEQGAITQHGGRRASTKTLLLALLSWSVNCASLKITFTCNSQANDLV